MVLLLKVNVHLCYWTEGGSPPASSPPKSLAGVRVGPLELANALAACALSARLTSTHRQWAAQQLVHALAVSEKENSARPQTYSDMAGDLRKCSIRKLEGHQNRVKRRLILKHKLNLTKIDLLK